MLIAILFLRVELYPIKKIKKVKKIIIYIQYVLLVI